MTKFGIGQAVRRVEDQRFTTGAGQYVGDLILPRQCYGVAVLSPHAHALIKSIDVAAAKAAPGVVCVLTGADAVTDKVSGIPPFFMPESWGGPKGFPTTRAGAAGRSRPPRRRSCRLRRRRKRGAGARCGRARCRRLSAAAGARRSRSSGETARGENLERLPERKHRGDDRVRRSRRQPTRPSPARSTLPRSAWSTTA